MVTLDDLYAAVQARFAASPECAQALPGGLHPDRGPDEPAGAYAVMTLERDGDPEWDSSGTYLQGYTLRVAAYTTHGRLSGPADAESPQAAQLALAAAINPGPTEWTPLRAGFVNCCLPEGYDGRFDRELREGRDVFAAAGQWALLIEGTR